MTDKRPALAAMYTGLALTILATAVPYVDRATGNALAEHIRAGYPSYPQERIEVAANTYLIYLSVVGVLGVIGWAVTIWAVKAGRRFAPLLAAALLAAGVTVGLFNLFVRDTSGDTGLPPMLALVGLLPCLPGVAAVTLLWTRRKEVAA